MLLQCAVIGNPILHSLSPIIHQAFAEQTNLSLNYEKIQGEDALFEQQVLDFFAGGGRGLNVTLPYKQRAFAMAKRVSEPCRQAHAANTLWVKENVLYADNTDGTGLIRDLARYINVQGKKILVLGAGGAARGIIHPLLKEAQKVVVANRSVEALKQLKLDIPQIECVNWEHLNLAGHFDVLINATSAGLSGESMSLPLSLLANHPFCYDLMYDLKVPTTFVNYVQKRGCDAVDGIGMLVEQAAEAFYLWHERKPNTAPVLHHLKKFNI